MSCPSRRGHAFGFRIEAFGAERRPCFTMSEIKLEQLDQLKSDFVSNVSHELRTPLQGIHGFTLILEEIVESPEQKEYIQAINLLVKRLVKLSEISLLFTEIKAKNYEIILKPLSLRNTINHVLEIFRTEHNRIEVIRDLTNDNIYVKSDQRLLNTCLELIIDNALKYTPESG